MKNIYYLLASTLTLLCSQIMASNYSSDDTIDDVTKSVVTKKDAISYINNMTSFHKNHFEKEHCRDCRLILTTHDILADLGTIMLKKEKYQKIGEFFNWWNWILGENGLDYRKKADVETLRDQLNTIIEDCRLKETFGPIIVKEAHDNKNGAYYYLKRGQVHSMFERQQLSKTSPSSKIKQEKSLLQKCNKLTDVNGRTRKEIVRRIKGITDAAQKKIDQIKGIDEQIRSYMTLVYDVKNKLEKGDISFDCLPQQYKSIEANVLDGTLSNNNLYIAQNVEDYLQNVNKNDIDAKIKTIINMCIDIEGTEIVIIESLRHVFNVEGNIRTLKTASDMISEQTNILQKIIHKNN